MNLILLALGFTMPIIAIAAPLTSKQGDEMLQELRQIRQLLERQQAARTEAVPKAQVRQLFEAQQGRTMAISPAPVPEQSAKLNILGAPALGRTDAPLVLVMYTDYECAFCRRFETQTLPEIRKHFITPGKLKFVVMDAPIDSHVNARKAAEATRCAAEQNRYWEFRNKLSVANEPLDTVRIQSYASEAGLDSASFAECINSSKYSKPVADAVAEAGRQGVNGTPTFVMGAEKNGIVEGVRIIGAQPYAVFERKLNDLLEKK